MLSDYRVLDLTDARGALCGQLLADLGADVLRVEPSGGSPMRRDSSWSIFARNCASCVLDVERPENRPHLERLVSDADLVIAHDIALGELNYSALRERQPGLVWLAITPFGLDGPKSSYQATDLIVQAAGGAMAINGFDDAKPLRTGAITAWSHAGAAAAGAALLALRQRDKTGRGQLVDISAQLSVNLTASFSLLTPFAGATRMRRAKQNPVGAIPLIWPASDGFVSITLAFAGPMIGFARNLFAWMREANALDERLAQLDWPTYLEQLRRGNAEQNDLDDLLEALGQFLAARKKDELLEGAIAHGALLVPVSSTHDLLDSPQLAARNFWWVDEDARQPGPFAHFSAAPLRLRSPAPAYNPDQAGGFLPRPDHPLPAVSASNDDPALPLAGVKILDFSWVMAGPWCTRLLADYGATVVKVESRTRMDLVRVLGPFYNDQFSPETSASFASINAGKLSIDLDPNQPEGKAKLLELVDWADIVVESFSPRAMKKWGLDYACLQERKPGIIMLSSCLFGQTGPYARMAGYGTMGAALGGLVLPTGLPGRPPCGPFGPYTDYIAPRFSVIALLAALHHRDRTGTGQHIDQSQAESSTLLMSAAITASSLGAPAPDRLGNEHADRYPHDVYPCSGDDQWVAVAVRDQEDWQALCGILGRKDWADLTLASRRERRDEIDQAITTWTQPRPATEVEVTLQRQNLPAHSVMNATLSRNDPQFTHRRHFQATAHSTLDRVYVESAGYKMELAQPCVGKIPSLGGDKDDVLAMVPGAQNEVKPHV